MENAPKRKRYKRQKRRRAIRSVGQRDTHERLLKGIIADKLRLGATMVEIAEEMGITHAQIWSWYAEDPQLKAAYMSAKNEFDDRVEHMLHHRALNGSDTAAIFWLKNRRPGQWRDKRDVDVGGDVNLNVNSPTPRQLAMAVMDVLRGVGAEDEQGTVIEHEPAPEREPEAVRESVEAGLPGAGEDDPLADLDIAS